VLLDDEPCRRLDVAVRYGHVSVCVTTLGHLGPGSPVSRDTVTEIVMLISSPQSRSLRGALTLAAVTIAFAVGACTLEPAPSSYGYQPDPVLLGHAQWCGTNPASGYCDVRVRR
jgi:hypothetical protein